MECTFTEQQPPASHELTQEEANPGTDCWKLYVDGSSTAERSRAGLILISPEGFTIQQAINFAFKATNNQAEYEALISGLNLAKSLGISKMVVYSDSQIVVKQTNGEYIAKDPTLAQYQAMVRNILGTTPDITIHQINREENSKADELSKLVQNTSDIASSVYFEELEAPSMEQSEVLCIGSPDNWMTPYIVYLRDRTLPEDQNKARYLQHKAARFFLENGICGDHLAAKALAYKVIRQGYYWPTVHAHSIAYVKKCPQCQKFNNVPRQSPNLPALVLSPIPFAIWGIDIMGPFPRAKDDLRYVLVAIDYMTKWAEAKAMRTINQQDCIKFMDTIVMRFGIPNHPRTGTNETPFKLAYGTEARIPIETGSPSHRVINFDEISNIEGLKTNLELLDEVRDNAVKRMESYKEKTKLYFTKKIKIREYEAGDLVLRHTEASDPTNQGKLQPNWEGSYMVKEVLRPGTYKLSYLGGTEVPNTWHGARLRKFYQ
ncbi:uncharacterized protein LOC141691723 [Apium graveolens]|uniref:uncharacterized protein LOC141691723 n=1 Tax=Apium graveolens TaxID=4045 RepID=UPI003D79AF60